MTAQIAASWRRDTPWRQASVMPTNVVQTLGLAGRESAAEVCVVVISHDCDLANDDLRVEPDVEVIAGKLVSANGSLMWGKSPRTLHLTFDKAGQQVAVELSNSAKQRVGKIALAPFAPDPGFHLDARGLNVLRSWLASRYQRAAFADRFVERIRAHKLDVRIETILKKHGEVVCAIYFDIDDGKMLDRADGSAYSLKIVVACVGGDAADTAADEIEKKIVELFNKTLFNGKTSQWTDIKLVGCVAMSEDDIPLSRVRVLTPWRLEHLSLRAEDNQPGPVTT